MELARSMPCCVRVKRPSGICYPPVSFESVSINDLEGTMNQIRRVIESLARLSHQLSSRSVVDAARTRRAPGGRRRRT